VFDLIFPNLDREKANTCKACGNKKDNNKSDKSEDDDGDKSE
jgi:Lon-like ATP-dependent protease